MPDRGQHRPGGSVKALVTGAAQASPADLETLAALGLDVTVHPDERAPVAAPEQYEIVVCNGLFLSNDIENFTALRFLQLTSAGLDRVPLDAIRRRGIRLHNASGVYSGPMAEFALWGVLELYKQGRFFSENQRFRRWLKHRSLRELDGKTVGILGCGSVGSACAKRFSAFGCTVLGIATTAREQAFFDAVYPMDQLDALLPRLDILVLALPLTDHTHHLLNAERLALLKQEAVLVNLARGAIVDTDALLRALDSRLSGAVLDVFETEPLSEDHPLWAHPNVILTPHNSFVGEHNHQRMMELLIRNLRSFL